MGGGLIELEVAEVFIEKGPVRVTPAPEPDAVMEMRWLDFRTLARLVRERPEHCAAWLRVYIEQGVLTVAS